MKCPHCAIEVHPNFRETRINGDSTYWGDVGSHKWTAAHMTCPACEGALIYLAGKSGSVADIGAFLAHPKTTGRQRAPTEVPAHIAEDYHEACAVLDDSPKASAALSRRCLQAVLRGNGFPQKDLAPAIQAAIDSLTLPSAIADNLDAIRNIGNFAAHPMKNKSTGEILPVEPHEAEWNLDVLEELFDFFYVQPTKARLRREALNKKLDAAGKPLLKV